jgi:hypothetical protein
MEITAEIQQLIDDEKAALKAKNDELIIEMRKLRLDSVIDPKEFSDLKEQNINLQEKLNEQAKALKQAAKQFDDAQKSLKAESEFTQRLLIDNGISEALVSERVKPGLLKAAKAILEKEAAIQIDGDKRSALIGGKPLKDAIAEWAKSDEGKEFIAAPANQGGGAPGGTQAGSASKVVNRQTFDAMAPGDKMTFAKAGGVISDSL